jgi:hypothetical protein
MGMYEEAIEFFTTIADSGPAHKKYCDAVIALMRAAEPKDDAAEREHCMHVAWDISDFARVGHPFKNTKVAVVETLVRERAAARAEGYASGAATADTLPYENEIERLTASLALAQDCLRRGSKGAALTAISNAMETVKE